MCLRKFLAPLLLLLLLSIPAQAIEPLKASTTCELPPLPLADRFKNLKAVGLIVSASGVYHQEIPALDKEKLINLFAKRIREQILPFVTPNQDCQIPDLVIFRDDSSHFNDRFYLDEFINRDDTLTVKVNLGSYPSVPNLKLIQIQWNYFRVPDIKQSWRSLNGSHGIIFPSDTSDEEIEKQISKLLKDIFVDTVANGPTGGSRESGAAEKNGQKAMEAKPPISLIPLPPTPTEKSPRAGVIFE